MKRILSLILALVLLLSCASFAAADEKPTITVWMPVYQFGDGPDDLTFWNEHLADFAAANNCNIVVEIKPWTDYYTVAYTAMAGTDGPDVVYGPNFDFVNNGLCLPLDEYFTEEEKANMLYWNSGIAKDGQMYTAPMMVGNAVAIFFNMDILNAAGITEMPATWEDFIAMCKTVQAANLEGVKPFLLNLGASSGSSALLTGFWPFYLSAGGKILDENGYPDINNEAGLKTLEFLKALVDEGIFDESIVAEDGAVGMFEEGKLAAVMNGTGKSKSFGDYAWDYKVALEGPGGSYTTVAAEGLGVNVKTKNPELAVGVLKEMLAAKSMDDFFTQVYSMAKISADSTYVDPVFDDLYSGQADHLLASAEFEGKGSFENTLLSNIQLMLMGDMEPQEVLDETMAYYNDQIRQ